MITLDCQVRCDRCDATAAGRMLLRDFILQPSHPRDPPPRRTMLQLIRGAELSAPEGWRAPTSTMVGILCPTCAAAGG